MSESPKSTVYSEVVAANEAYAAAFGDIYDVATGSLLPV